MHNFYYIGPAESGEEALERLREHRGPVAIDTETIGLKGDKSVPWFDEEEEEDEVKALLDEDSMDEIKVFQKTRKKIDARTMIGIGIALSPTEAFYFPRGRREWVNVPICDLGPIQDFLHKDNPKYFFNSMFDIERIEEAFGILIDSNFGDVAIAAQVQGLPNSLDRNVLYYLGYYHTDISDILPKGKTMLDLKFSDVAHKCMYDCMDTLKLAYLMKLDKWNCTETITWVSENALPEAFTVSPEIQSCYVVDRDCVPLLRRMSRRGIALHKDKVNYWHNKLEQELRPYVEWFQGKGINIFSNDQLGWYLSSDRGHYIGRTKSGKHLKVDEEVLRKIGERDPVVFMALAARRRRKLKSTYINPLFGKDRGYTHFNLNLATGRLSSHGPDVNIQNQPDLIREIYAAENETGEWAWADLEQAELRVWAFVTQDQAMLQAFREGSSPHKATLGRLFPGVPSKVILPSGAEVSTREYTDSKSFNFALLFDSSDETLAKTTKRPVHIVHAFKQELFGLYKDSRRYMLEMKDSDDPWVEDIFGRRMRIPDAPYVTEDHRYKCRLNYPVQGGVASYIKRGMRGLDAMGMDFPAQIHDEILQDGDLGFPKWLSTIHPEIPMPFEVKSGVAWG